MKPALTLAQQLAQLGQRGLAIADDQQAARFLYDTNYYRLSRYLRIFQENPNEGRNMFKSGSTFEHVRRVYLFDETLRQYLSDALGLLEVTFRSRFAYQVALSHASPVDYLSPSSYASQDKAADTLEIVRSELERSREPFIEHFRRAGESVPIWAAVEVLSFGTISRMFANIADTKVLDKIAASFDLPRATVTSTFHNLAVLRNTCAHHGRVWNRIQPRALAIPKRLRPNLAGAEGRSPFASIVVLADLVTNIDARHPFKEQITDFLNENKDLLEGVKFPRVA